MALKEEHISSFCLDFHLKHSEFVKTGINNLTCSKRLLQFMESLFSIKFTNLSDFSNGKVNTNILKLLKYKVKKLNRLIAVTFQVFYTRMKHSCFFTFRFLLKYWFRTMERLSLPWDCTTIEMLERDSVWRYT